MTRLDSTTAIMTIAMFIQSFALFLALFQIILLPLQEDVVQMAHFDPTEIIAIPLGKDMLLKFVLVSIGCLVAIQTTLVRTRSQPKQPIPIPVLCQVALLNAFSTIITFFLSILCGVSPTKQIIPSLLGCFYVSTIAFAPLFYYCLIIYWSIIDTRKTTTRPGINRFQDIGFLLLESLAQYFCLGENDNDEHDPPVLCQISTCKDLNCTSTILTSGILGSCTDQDDENINICFENFEWVVQDARMQSDLKIIIPNMIGSLIGVSVCSILTILDWGSQLQRWPLPMLLGATGGHLCGTIWSVCSSLRRKRNSNMNLRYSTLHNTTTTSDHKVE